jgi:hypothetical protein
MDDSLSVSSHSSTTQENDSLEFEKYQAIEELIRFKGQNKFLNLLK